MTCVPDAPTVGTRAAHPLREWHGRAVRHAIVWRVSGMMVVLLVAVMVLLVGERVYFINGGRR